VALWRDDPASYQGEYVAFSNVRCAPRCVQRPHVPLLIGGSTEAALRRVVEFGAGWAPMLAQPNLVSHGVHRLAELCAAAGKDPEHLRIFTRIPVMGGNEAVQRAAGHQATHPQAQPKPAGSQEAILETIDAYRAAGVTELGLSFPWRSATEYVERLEWFANQIICHKAEGDEDA
jgi:alkanesulfonate monooxygenase SsuD/methylene tetrahydromethanopterin reductase-like flavin-dependent oxidoreductase (luciferase family)